MNNDAGRADTVEPLERLIDASKRGDLEGVRAIAEKHPELLHGKDETGATALHYAALTVVKSWPSCW